MQTSGPDPHGQLRKGEGEGKRFVIFVRTQAPQGYEQMPPTTKRIMDTSVMCSMQVLHYAKAFVDEVKTVEIDSIPRDKRPSWLTGVPILLDMNLPLGNDGDYQRKKGKEAIEYLKHQADVLQEAQNEAVLQAPPMKNTCTPCEDEQSWNMSSGNQPVYNKNGVQFDTVPASSAIASVEAKFMEQPGKVTPQMIAEYQKLREDALQQSRRRTQNQGQPPVFQQLKPDGTPAPNDGKGQQSNAPEPGSFASSPAASPTLAAFQNASAYLQSHQSNGF